jgi:Protein of unknown function (DUF1376)
VLPLWVGDFLADTMDLSTAEVGAYMLLLMAAWRFEGSLPNNQVELAQITRTNYDHWHRVRKPRILHRFFRQGEDGRWRQKRLTKELKRVDKFAKNRGLLGKNPNSQPGYPQPESGKNPDPKVADRELGKNPRMSQVSSSMISMKKNEQNGPLNPRSKIESFSKANRPSGLNGRKVSKNLGRKNTEAALHRQASNAARVAWEADLAKRYQPDILAKIIDRLSANPTIADRATAREQEEPGSGALVVAVALLKTQTHDQRKI